MVYALIYLFLEVMITTAISNSIGGLLTFLEIILSATIGIFLLKGFKDSLALNIQGLTQGQLSQADFIKNNMAKALGAILLLVPGFFTDILGLLLQFGILTFMLTKLFSFKPPMQTNGFKVDPNINSTNNELYTQSQFTHKTKGNTNEEDIIDVEIIESSDSTKS